MAWCAIINVEIQLHQDRFIVLQERLLRSSYDSLRDVPNFAERKGAKLGLLDLFTCKRAPAIYGAKCHSRQSRSKRSVHTIA